MPESDSSQPFSYELEVLTLVNNEGEGFDIRKVFLGFKLFESVTQNFLSGECSIIDATGMLENAKLFGQESLRIRFKSPFGMNDESHEDDIIDQVFRIYHVGEVQRIGQSTLTYNLRFCAPELLQAKRIRVSQAFRGSMTDIAGKIAKDNLGIAIDSGEGAKLTPYFQTREKSKGENLHIVVPNWSVNYAINWLCSQAQGVDSSSGLQDSYFFYQTANAGFRMESLASMLRSEYLSGDPFVYTTVSTENQNEIPWDNVEPGRMGMGRKIQAYSVGSSANILEATVEGLFASKQTTVDTTYQYKHEKSYNYLDKFYSGSGDAMNDYPMVRQEDEVIHIGESAGENDDVGVSPYETYDNIGTYTSAHEILVSDKHFVNDIGNKIHQPGHNAHEGSAQFRQAVKQLFNYYTLNLTLPVRTDITSGQLINVQLPPARPGEAETPEPLFHSGMHLITDIMWELTTAECQVHIKCIKDSHINQIETTSVKLPERMDSEG